MKKVLAIDIGGTFIKYGLVDTSYQLSCQGKVSTPYESKEHFIETLYGIYKEFQEEVEGIAISAPGAIDVSQGYMRTAGMLVYLNGFPIVEELSKKCDGVKVTVENDARSATLCEYKLGAGKGCDSLVSMIFGSGIGGGVIIDGKLLYGKQIIAGEFSPILCNMNANDYTSLASSFSTLTTVQKLQSRKGDETLTGEDMMRLYREEDKDTVEVVEEWCEVIAKWCYNIDCLYNPDCICIGGGISLDTLFYDIIMKYIDIIKDKAYVFRKPVVKLCSYHNDANLLGAYLTYQASNLSK